MGERETTSMSPDEIETGTAGRACEACHKKKTKCDMQQPVCGLCRRTGKECHFPSTRKRPSRQEPSVRAKLQKVNGNLDRLVELLEANPNLETESLKGLLGGRSGSTGSRAGNHPSPGANGYMADVKAALPINDHGYDFTASRRASAANVFPVSHDLAVHLVDLYFDKIQPWIPIFHRPTFLEWSQEALAAGEDAFATLSLSQLVMLNSMFSLSARFSNHRSLADLQPMEKGEKFMKAAEYWFKVIRDAEEYDLTYLRGCVLLANYHYASGCSKRGWYIAHVCIRGCYELSLHQIDDVSEIEQSNDDEFWIEKEALRRLFWSIWEVDSFGSIVKRKPFAIDWRHIEVKMPVSDEAWFAGQKIESNKFVPGPESWRTLVGSPNQDARAWSLLSKSIVGYVFDLMLFKEGITTEQLTTSENSICCFKLAMPELLQLTSPSWSTTSVTLARKNWAIATNLYLSAASFILTRLPITNQTASHREETQSKELAVYSSRVMEINEILRRWPADALPYAHPCLACTILTYDESLINLLPPSNLVVAYRDLSGLILARIAERWQLGAVLLRVRDLAHNYYNSGEEAKAELVRLYPIYFERELRKHRKPIVEEAQRTWTPAASSPSIASPRYRASIEQSSSPEQISQGQMTMQQPLSQSQKQQQTQQQPQPPPPQQQQHQQHQQHQQLPTPPLSYPSGGTMDVFDYSNNNNNNTDTFQNFNSFSTLDQNPEDIDALFSGFLQEPWWQDYGAVNFVV